MLGSLGGLSRSLSAQLDLPIKCSWDLANDLKAIIQLDIFERGHGFILNVMQPYEHQLSIEVAFGNYSGGLLQRLAQSAACWYDALKDGVPATAIRLEIGPHRISCTEDLKNLSIDQWRANKDAIRITARPINQPSDLPDNFVEAVLLASLTFLLAHCDLPAAADEDGDLVEEGARMQATVSRAERSRLNRARCIAHHGKKCAVCGFDFEEQYGNACAGYIEVHHITPLSELDKPTAIDPKTDLIPLCSNCHSAVHTRRPPIHPEELKAMISQRSSNDHPRTSA